MTNKYLVTIEFRYLGTPKNDLDSVQNTKINTIGVFDTFETACIEGNKVLEILEASYPLNPHYNKKERFSINGGCFNSKKDLITNLGYIKTPFEFYANITTLVYEDIQDVLNNVENTIKEYREFEKSYRE